MMTAQAKRRALDPTAPLTVLIVGAGGRDHALAWKLAQSPRCAAIHAAPGNAGIAKVGTCHADVAFTDVEALLELAQRIEADLVVVGAEDLLVAGMADRFLDVGIPVLGPTAAAARIEGSKAFAKGLMDDLGVPTPPWQTFTDAASAHAAIDSAVFVGRGVGVAVKADGLAAGRGAFVCHTAEEAHEAVDSLMVDEVFGASGDRVLIEQLVAGREVSVMVATDGVHVVPLPSARDYKRLGDGDTGPNTGGMGAHAPITDVSADEMARLADIAVRPVVTELARRGTPFRGNINAGVMLTEDGPQVLEYNCRFGNPETQALVRILDADLLDLLARVAAGALEPTQAVPRSRGCAVAVCVATEHYPTLELEPAPVVVTGLEAAEQSAPGVVVFTGMADAVPGTTDTLRAAGGRVATVTAHADTFEAARDAAYAAAAHIDVPGAQLRRDVAAGEVLASRR
jgi:phosphoribosylamine--glycine ligase